MISKVISTRLRKVISHLINENQIAYLQNIFISEGGRLISDILEITDLLQTEGILLAVDIEKAFDSINHLFLISVLEKYGFKSNFIKWIKILLKNQESCVINGGKTTKYFNLSKARRSFVCISFHSCLRNCFHQNKSK